MFCKVLSRTCFDRSGRRPLCGSFDALLLAFHDTSKGTGSRGLLSQWDTAVEKSMADDITLKIFASATNPSEVGRRKTLLSQTAKAFGAVRVEPVEVKFDSVTFLIRFDDLGNAKIYQDDCKKQPLLRVIEGVPVRYERNLNK
jgi:hypothetical protein